jgi:hypothetical protein
MKEEEGEGREGEGEGEGKEEEDIAQMPYSGANSLFIKCLINKVTKGGAEERGEEEEGRGRGDRCLTVVPTVYS